MKYMVIETFKAGSAEKIYQRYDASGRMLPSGLSYIDSWITADRKRCFQLMETDNESLFDDWIENWDDLVDFEVIPIQDSPTKSTRQSATADAAKAAPPG